MLVVANCYTRKCKHFVGVKSDATPQNPEMNERYYCKAFSDRIPSDIVGGKNLHETPIKGQKNNIVYEKG